MKNNPKPKGRAKEWAIILFILCGLEFIFPWWNWFLIESSTNDWGRNILAYLFFIGWLILWYSESDNN